MKKFWTVIIVILVVLAGWWWMKSNGSVNLPSALNSILPSYSTSPSVSARYYRKTATPAPTDNLSYTQLAQQFGSNRIQFDSSCQAQPSSIVFKNGARILLDNRSNQTISVGLNGANYTLGAYGYQVVTLASSNIPTTLSLSCNNRMNVGTIQLQANISGQ